MGNLTPNEDCCFLSGRNNSKATMRRLAFAGARMHRRYSAGFTMVEVMIVVAIIAILAAIAYPSYTKYIIKTNRSAAAACLSEYANYMERFYTSNLRYDQDSSGNAIVFPTLDCASQTASKYSYGFASGQPKGSTYTLQAIPVSGSPQAGDTQCATLQLDQAGNRMETGTDTNASDCW